MTVNKSGLSDMELALGFYKTMKKIRTFGEAAADMYRKGKIRGYLHSYTGQEAVAAGVCKALRKDDYVISNHRCQGHFIAKGSDVKLIMAELFGKSTGLSMGRGGSMHLTDPSNGLLVTSAIVGGGIPISTGVAMGVKLEKSDKVIVCFLGDGAANNGVFGESLNLAALYKLPVVYVIENNSYAATTSQQLKRQSVLIFLNEPQVMESPENLFSGTTPLPFLKAH